MSHQVREHPVPKPERTSRAHRSLATLALAGITVAAVYLSAHRGSSDPTPSKATHGAPSQPTPPAEPKPLYSPDVEVDIAKIIQPQMDKIGRFALGRLKVPDNYDSTPMSYTASKSGKNGTTEIYGMAPNGTRFDAVFTKDHKVVAADISTWARDAGNLSPIQPIPGTQGTASDEIFYAAPNMANSLTEAIGPMTGIFQIDDAGYTAASSQIEDVDGTLDNSLSIMNGTGDPSSLKPSNNSDLSDQAFNAYLVGLDTDTLLQGKLEFPS